MPKFRQKAFISAKRKRSSWNAFSFLPHPGRVSEDGDQKKYVHATTLAITGL
jgi:hypothetical protein